MSISLKELRLVSEKEEVSQAQLNRLSRFLRKILVLLISLIDLIKIFMNLKAESEVFKVFNISENFRKMYQNELEKYLEGSNLPALEVCPHLLSMGVRELAESVEVEDLQFYHWINRNYLDKKTVDKEFHFRDIYGKNFQLCLSFRDKCQIICSKIKRKDEILKFTFKFLRKKILFKYERDNKKQARNQLDLKNIFNSEILNDDKNLIDRFYSYDVSKKDLIVLKENPKIYDMLIDHFLNQYIIDAIENILSFDQEEIYKNMQEIILEKSLM